MSFFDKTFFKMFLLMGGITFIIYYNSNINIDYIKSFMNIKHRGPHDTSLTILTTNDLNSLNTQNQQIVQSTLTKDQIRKYIQYIFILGYHRLCVNDLSYNASQPFIDPILTQITRVNGLGQRPQRNLLCNGEIYNYLDLKTTNNFGNDDLSSICDVEIILPLYIKYCQNYDANNALINCINDLDGDFSFVITENIETFILSNINTFVVKDIFGIKPLYYIKNSNICMFASEIKAIPIEIINNLNYSITHVLPGTYWSFQNTLMNNKPSITYPIIGDFIQYYSLNKYNNIDDICLNDSNPDSLNNIYTTLQTLITNSIISRFNMCNKPIGILLSGGFDSCLLTSILIKYLIETSNTLALSSLHIFTVGDSLGCDDIDCNYAIQFINFLESKYDITLHHHVININDIEILTSDIETIIYSLETYDPTTCKESIPFYYLLQYIKKYTNTEVLLTGDGIDEIACGYFQFNKITDYNQFQNTSITLLENMHKFSLLRTDRISNKFSLEIRHPFINKQLTEYMLSIHPKLKSPQLYSTNNKHISKYIIRKAFDSSVYPDNDVIIPYHILWRTQSCLSNSLTNFEIRLNNYFESYITDTDFNKNLNILINENQNSDTLPTTKEQMYYRLCFRKYFSNRDSLIDIFWTNLFPTQV